MNTVLKNKLIEDSWKSHVNVNLFWNVCMHACMHTYKLVYLHIYDVILQI